VLNVYNTKHRFFNTNNKIKLLPQSVFHLKLKQQKKSKTVMRASHLACNTMFSKN